MLIDHWTHKVGLLFPLHAALIIGLAEGSDPLARLCATHPLPDFSRHVALGVYLLQAPTQTALALATGWATPYTHQPLHELALLGVLVMVAACTHVLVQRPLSNAMLAACEPRRRDACSTTSTTSKYQSYR